MNNGFAYYKPHNVIASQLSFLRGATPLEYVWGYAGFVVGTVLRVRSGKEPLWKVDYAEADYVGRTREEAVTKFLADNLAIAIHDEPKEEEGEDNELQ